MCPTPSETLHRIYPRTARIERSFQIACILRNGKVRGKEAKQMSKEFRFRDGRNENINQLPKSWPPNRPTCRQYMYSRNIPIRTICPHSIALFGEKRIVQVLLGTYVGLERLDGLDATSPTIGLFEQ